MTELTIYRGKLMIESIKKLSALLALGLFCISCTNQPVEPTKTVLRDGELPLPADYKTWPKFLADIQRTDNKQVRDIYINPTGYAGVSGKPFPYGTVMVMENYKAHLNAEGAVQLKDGLAAIFVMGKGEKWGADVSENLATGEWIFSAYKPDGSKSDVDLKTCRACHAPLKTKDFVHRFDEYFAQRTR